MNIYIFILFILVLLLVFRVFVFPILFGNSNKPMISGISQDMVDTEMTVVTNTLDKCIIKTLYEFIGKDHKFSEASSVPGISWGNYKALIDALVKVNVYLDDDNKV